MRERKEQLMNKNEVIEEILRVEWPMFHNVNGETRADCQENLNGFRRMRGAQYEVWSQEVCESYLQDLKEAEAAGRNLPREKYIHMMAATDPAGYEIFCSELPEISEEKKEMVEKIWAILGEQTDRLRAEYPLIALGGRPLHTADEFPGSTSVETYQKGELMTYSDRTLKLLLEQIEQMQKDGKEYAHDVQLATVLAAGYTSLRNAEEVMLERAKKQIREAQMEEILARNTGCPNCRRPE